MSQSGELERVKARIRALCEKTVSNGCTEAEAMAAAEMVGRLLDRYALSMAEVDLRAARCVTREGPLAGRQRRPIDACVPAIARFCDCRVWLSREGGEQAAGAYVFFGFEPDTALAAYLFALIARAMAGEREGFRRSQSTLAGVRLRQAGTSFEHGMASRIAERLDALLGEREAARAAAWAKPAEAASGGALVVLKHDMVAEAFRERAIRLVSAGRTLRARRDLAYRQGRAAGERVNLNRPLGADPPARLR
jgi:hypothetical protein